MVVVPSHVGSGSGSGPGLVPQTCLEALPGFRVAMRDSLQRTGTKRMVGGPKQSERSGVVRVRVRVPQRVGLGEIACLAEPERLCVLPQRR